MWPNAVKGVFNGVLSENIVEWNEFEINVIVATMPHYFICEQPHNYATRKEAMPAKYSGNADTITS